MSLLSAQNIMIAVRYEKGDFVDWRVRRKAVVNPSDKVFRKWDSDFERNALVLD